MVNNPVNPIFSIFLPYQQEGKQLALQFVQLRCPDLLSFLYELLNKLIDGLWWRVIIIKIWLFEFFKLQPIKKYMLRESLLGVNINLFVMGFHIQTRPTVTSMPWFFGDWHTRWVLGYLISHALMIITKIDQVIIKKVETIHSYHHGLNLG